MEIPFSELGIAGLSIATLGWMLKAFLAHLKEKDRVFTETIEKKDAIFTTTINNHIAHETEAKEKHTVAFEGFAKIMERLEKKL